MKRIKLTACFVIGLFILHSNSFAMSNQTWTFKVYLDEQEVGEHHFNVASVNDQTHVKINASFDVYFFFINAYSYRHSNHEIWKDQCLQSIRSTTDDNGEDLFVEAKLNNKKLDIKSSSGKHSEEGCIKTFAYWNSDFLKSRTLLNAQTGRMVDINVEKKGDTKIMIRNELIESTHYRLKTDEFTIDLWYSKDNQWLALNSTTSSGSTLRYQIQ